MSTIKHVTSQHPLVSLGDKQNVDTSRTLASINNYTWLAFSNTVGNSRAGVNSGGYRVTIFVPPVPSPANQTPLGLAVDSASNSINEAS